MTDVLDRFVWAGTETFVAPLDQTRIVPVGTVQITAPQFEAMFLAWWAGLPTTLPATAGKPWNNGGNLCVS